MSEAEVAERIPERFSFEEEILKGVLAVFLIKIEIEQGYSPKVFDTIDVKKEVISEVLFITGEDIVRIDATIYNELSEHLQMYRRSDVDLYTDVGYFSMNGDLVGFKQSRRQLKDIWYDATRLVKISTKVLGKLQQMLGDDFGGARLLRFSGVYGEQSYFDVELRKSIEKLEEQIRKLKRKSNELVLAAETNIDEFFYR